MSIKKYKPTSPGRAPTGNCVTRNASKSNACAIARRTRGLLAPEHCIQAVEFALTHDVDEAIHHHQSNMGSTEDE